MLFIDPYCVKWPKHKSLENMLFCSSSNFSDRCLELLPFTFSLNNVTYRHSRLAKDFCFCIPVVNNVTDARNTIRFMYYDKYKL